MIAAVKEKNCFECQEPINPNRIKALPNCTLCIKCQENNDIPVPRELAVDIGRIGITRTQVYDDGRHPCERNVETKKELKDRAPRKWNDPYVFTGYGSSRSGA